MRNADIPLIKMVEWSQNKLSGYDNNSYFLLEQDNWNDFGYFTSYHLHVSGKLTDDERPSLIGHVRILKKGQKSGDIYLLDRGTSISSFDEEFCSMGTSLDYYERIAQLPAIFRDKILIALRDIIIYPEIKEDFIREDGYKVSLLRNIPADDEMFNLAPLLISRDYHKLLDLDLNFGFSIPELEKPLEFNFDSPTFGWGKELPNRISVLIGRNGCGKSTLLSRISRIAFSSTIDRRDKWLKQVGKIKPTGLGFPRIILLSYSAFDAFNIPGIHRRDKETIVEEIKNGLGRYVFCGIRDIVAELELVLPGLETDENGKLLKDDILKDRIENTRLKSLTDLSEEFVRNLVIIKKTNRVALLLTAFDMLAEEKSMHILGTQNFIESSDKLNNHFFLNLSTGHKFVIHAITSIVAYAAPRSLLLFDEPETHLHPPILAALMKAIRFALSNVNAFMIVATHSPVILQETLKQHVHVVRREGDLMSVSQPYIETFGENIGILTQMAFGLTADITDYHNTLDELVEEYSEGMYEDLKPDNVLEKIEGHFEQGLSMQARSYILSKIYKG